MEGLIQPVSRPYRVVGWKLRGYVLLVGKLTRMDENLLADRFELTGSFGGFVYTESGKRRLVLQVDGHDCLLKVPRILRRRMIGKFRPGETIRVAGSEERDPVTGLLKRVVSQVLNDAVEAVPPATATTTAVVAVAVASPIRVCSKRNCWRQGGHALWQTLQQEIEARGFDGRIELRQVGCLDRCKRAPNVDWGDHEYSHCTAPDAAAIIGRATAGHG